MPAERRRGWDVHTHLIPAPVVDAGGRGEFGMSVEGDRLVTPALRVPMHRITRPDALLGWVEDQGLAGALVSPPPPLYRPDLGDADAVRWAGMINDGLVEECTDPRLKALAYLPAERPNLATRVVEDLDESWAGVVLGTDLGDLVYSSPELEALWEMLAGRGLPAFIHPGECPDDRLGVSYLGNLVGNPYETAVAAAHLVFGDVVGRHPGLHILLAHGGGATASLVGRWERGLATDRPGVGPLSLTPSEAVRRMWVDSLVHDPSFLRHVVTTFGIDSVMFGSDWPFPMGADSMADSLASLTEGEVDRIEANSWRMVDASPH